MKAQAPCYWYSGELFFQVMKMSVAFDVSLDDFLHDIIELDK